MILEVLLASGLVAASGTAVALAIRNAGIREELSRSTISLSAANAQLRETSHEFASFKGRRDRHLKALRVEIMGLEADVDECREPAVIRARVGRLLQKAAGRDGRDDS